MISEKVTVFLMEDNNDELEILKNFFESAEDMNLCGYDSDGSKGLEKVKELRPDVVVTDYVMPSMDGFLVLKELKQHFGLAMPKVILMSAGGNSDIIDSVFKEGANYYIKKPFRLSYLKEIIMRLTGESKKSTSLEDDKNIVRKLKKITMDLGVPVNIAGYNYIIESVRHMIEKENKSTFLNEIYDEIAAVNDTSKECVEIGIRNAIKKARTTNNENYRNFFENNPKAPSNSLFLNILKERLLIYS